MYKTDNPVLNKSPITPQGFLLSKIFYTVKPIAMIWRNSSNLALGFSAMIELVRANLKVQSFI